MSDGYSKNCQIEAIEPQQISPAVEFLARNTIEQVAEMCTAFLTERLGKAYFEKYGVHMDGKNREALTQLSKRKCAEYLLETSKQILKEN